MSWPDERGHTAPSRSGSREPAPIPRLRRRGGGPRGLRAAHRIDAEPFGVRRPLRFLAFKLQLEEAQVGELARILDAIKTERAQAAVDHRRAISSFADAIEGDIFDEGKAQAGASLRLQSADRLREAVVTALGRLHKLLDAQQRTRLAYLIRTGTLSI